MEAKKSLKAVAACALSVAMLFAGAACGTSDGSDDAASSDSGSKSSELTGYDVSSVQKDDDIAKLLPDYVTKDGKLTIGMDTSYAPAEFLAENGKTPVGFDVDIAKAVQAALQKLMDDGTYMKILKHWGVENGAIDKAEINPTDLG
jgi:polar amino acid transport system substrate-binding protein